MDLEFGSRVQRQRCSGDIYSRAEGLQLNGFDTQVVVWSDAEI